jgi:hypothetical protein
MIQDEDNRYFQKNKSTNNRSKNKTNNNNNYNYNNRITNKNNEKINKNNSNNNKEKIINKETKISKSVSIETFPLFQEKNMKIVSLVIHLPSNHFRKVSK